MTRIQQFRPPFIETRLKALAQYRQERGRLWALLGDKYKCGGSSLVVIIDSMKDGYQFRAYPTLKQIAILLCWIDRGVTVPLVGSDRQMWDILEAQQSKINQQERYKKRWQRRLARRVKGSVIGSWPARFHRARS